MTNGKRIHPATRLRGRVEHDAGSAASSRRARNANRATEQTPSLIVAALATLAFALAASALFAWLALREGQRSGEAPHGEAPQDAATEVSRVVGPAARLA